VTSDFADLSAKFHRKLGYVGQDGGQAGTELFKNANPALRTGLLSSVPCGTAFL